jgi:hypothetical protein
MPQFEVTVKRRVTGAAPYNRSMRSLAPLRSAAGMAATPSVSPTPAFFPSTGPCRRSFDPAGAITDLPPLGGSFGRGSGGIRPTVPALIGTYEYGRDSVRALERRGFTVVNRIAGRAGTDPEFYATSRPG